MEAFLGHDGLRATAQHIELLDAKIETLSRARVDSWAQMLTAASRLFVAGQADEFDLVALYDSMKISYGAGFSTVWDQHMPVEAGRMQFIRMSAPNGPMGSWVGGVPLGPRDPAPPKAVRRVWFWAPRWYWYGLATLWPVHFGGDEARRRTLVFGWTLTGRAIVAISRAGRLYRPDAELEDWGCCALDDGHDGRCAWLCSGCQGGRCPECHGTGGPDDVVRCDWCEGSGACPEGCFEGWVSDDAL